MRLALIARASRRGRAGLGVNVATRQPLKRLCSNFDPLFLDLLDLPIPRCQPPLIFNPAPNAWETAMEMIVLDTLDKLYHHGHGMFSWCSDCRLRDGGSMGSPLPRREP
jgi:hypothetical protein